MTITLDEIRNRYDYMIRFYAQRNTNMLSWRELYFLTEESTFFDDNGAKLPKRPEEVRVISPMPYNIVEGFRTLLLTKPPVLSVPPSTVKKVDRDSAQKIEDILYVLWDRANVFQETSDALWHGLVDGWSCMLAYYDVSAGDEESPVAVRSIDPLGVFPAPGRKRGEWAYVLTVEDRAASAVKAEWLTNVDGRTALAKDVQQALSGLRDDKMLKVIGYWDKDYHAVAVSLAGGTYRVSTGGWNWLLRPREHGYGRLPWAIWHEQRLPFSDRGERMGISVLFPVQDSLRYLNRLLSQKATIISRFADPTKVFETDRQSGDWQEGATITITPDERVSYLDHQGPSPQVDVQLQTLMGMIEDTTLPRHMYGQYVGRLSGVSMSLLRTPVLMKIAFMQEAIERALTQLNEVILSIISHKVKKDHVLYGRGPNGAQEVVVNANQVGEYYRNEVRLSTSLPTDEPQIVSMLTTLLQTSVLSSDTVRNVVQQTLGDLVGQNLQNEEELVYMDKFLLNNPQVGMALAMVAAERAGIDIKTLMQSMQQPAQPQREGMVRPGAEAGLAAQNPLNAIQTTQPDATELLQRIFAQGMGQQGGRPSEIPAGQPNMMGVLPSGAEGE